MYRSYLLFLLLCILAGMSETHHRHSKHRHSRIHHPEKLFDQVARDIISADRKVHNLCSDKNDTIVKMFYEEDKIALVVRLPEFDVKDISVKINHRVILIHAETEGKKSDRKTFASVRILPDVADTKQATWTFTEGELVEVKFPYKKETSCVDVIDDEVVCIPRTLNHEETKDEGSAPKDQNDLVGDIRKNVIANSEASSVHPLFG